MADFVRALQVAEEIQAFVARSPALAGFRQATDELVENARRAAAGDVSIGPLATPSTADLPDRAAADEIVRLAGLMPGPDGSEDEAALYALGQIHGNVVEAVMHAVFARFPEAVHDAMGDQ